MKKIFKLSLIVFSFLLNPQGAYTQILAGQDTGQVFFYDFVPDTGMYIPTGQAVTGYCDLDLTGDGVMDFGLRVYHTYSMGHQASSWAVVCFDGNQVMMSGVTGYAAAISYMDTIDQNSNWSSADTIAMGGIMHLNLSQENFYSGPWSDTFAVDKYLGVRIFSFGDTIHGYIHICRCSLLNPNLLIRDYGIDRMDVGVGEISKENNFLLFPNPSTGKFTIRSNIMLHDEHVEVFNSSGELVHNENISDTTSEIDLGNISQGIYVVKITDQNRYYLKKIIIEKD